MKFETPSMKKRVGALIAAGALAASMAGMPLTAMAADNTPSAGEQVATGTTDVYVQTIESGETTGGGENITFTVPTSINFVSNAAGVLTGPSTSINNTSNFAIHASSFDVDEQNGWHIIDDGTGSASSLANSADFQFGPNTAESGQPVAPALDAYDYLTKNTVAAKNAASAGSFNMAAHNGSVPWVTSGNIYNVSQNIQQGKVKIATIQTFVTQGNYGTTAGQTTPSV